MPSLLFDSILLSYTPNKKYFFSITLYIKILFSPTFALFISKFGKLSILFGLNKLKLLS
jgi:hypothetical protein